MSLLDVGILLKIFYKNPLNYIPLLDFNQKEESYIVGFLSRYKVLQFSADKSRLEEKFVQIPDFLIDKKIQPLFINEFFQKAPIPVYNLFAKYIENWEKDKINYYLKNYLYAEFYSITTKNDENLDSKLHHYHTIESILSSIPFPLFAISCNGISIFYNQFFIDDILEKGPFKKTLGLAEAFFKEVVERAIAENIKKNLDIDNIWIYIQEIEKQILISTLMNENEVVGYLIIFLKYPFLEQKKENQINPLIAFVESYLKQNLSYVDIIEKIEKEMIQEFLKKNSNNISLTAEFLKINRTTLQNKIKRLNINLHKTNDETNIKKKKKKEITE